MNPNCPKCKLPMPLLLTAYDGYFMNPDATLSQIRDVHILSRMFICHGCKVYVEVDKAGLASEYKPRT